MAGTCHGIPILVVRRVDAGCDANLLEVVHAGNALLSLGFGLRACRTQFVAKTRMTPITITTISSTCVKPLLLANNF